MQEKQSVRAGIKNIGLLFLGVLATSSVVALAHVVQGLAINDWSGVHPYYRFFQLPVFIVIGVLVGVLSIGILRVKKGNKAVVGYGYFMMGLAAGTSGLSGVVRPWVDFYFMDIAFIFLAFLFSVLVGVKFSGVARVTNKTSIV